MPLVMLRRDAFSPFRKRVRNAQGAIVKTLEFEPGVVVDLSQEDADVIKDDLYHALYPMRMEGGKPFVIDREEFYAEFETSVPVDAAAVMSTTETIAPVEPVNNTPADEPHRGKKHK